MEASSQAQLLVLHGALGSAKQMEDALQPHSKNTQIHSFDFPGHGQYAGQAFSINSCVAATRDFILKHHLAGTTIFAYSMGGYVALVLAKQYPHLVGQMITLGTKLNWNKHFVAGELPKLNAKKIEEKVPHYAQFLAKLHGKKWPIVLDETKEMMKQLGDEPLLNDAAYNSIMHPVLLCLANQDDMVSREETIHAAWTLPFGEFAELPKSKHPIEKVDMTALRRLIRTR